MNAASRAPRWLPWLLLPALVVLVFGLRWPTFGFRVWNVDEAIHAAVARTLLDGGVLYRDAIDQRTPLTYYAVAGLFKVTGENNVWAMHALAAALIAATSVALFLLGRRWRGNRAGFGAALLYAVFATALFPPGDAYALNTEWFVAALTAWAAWAFARGRAGISGGLLGLAFLSKQPALLDLGAPLLVLVWGARTGRIDRPRAGALLVGFATPVILTGLYFLARGAIGDAIFYAWQYNLQYYGPEIDLAARAASALKPFQLLGANYGLALLLAIGAAAIAVVRVLQRSPTPTETISNPAQVYLLAWTITSLAGAAAGGRGFDHYYIQFLPPFTLLAAWGGSDLLDWARAHRASRYLQPAAGLFLLATTLQLSAGVMRFRAAAHQPVDPSIRVAEYIHQHSAPDDRIFVWGYHPDIYLFSDRRPASRFVYASFLSGLIPWTNVASEKDTRYAIVPGARETLLRELTARPPAFIVDCSAGPNRFWQKYPLDTFPELEEFIRAHYRIEEASQFVPQGFRLFRRRAAGDPLETDAGELPAATSATLALRVMGSPIPPATARAPHGASLNQIDGHVEYFAHAPSRLVYRVPAGATALRGGFGIRAAAYADSNRAPTDGAEFVIRWRAGTSERVLLRQLLRPRTEAGDRALQSFRVEFPTGAAGELELSIDPGPAHDPSSDWTYWSDLVLETAR